MKKIIYLKLAAVFAAMLAFTFAASAHYVWIEDVGKKVVVRFAEWPDEWEKSPGYLDDLSVPSAWTAGTNGEPKTFEIKKKAEYYQIVGASSKEVITAETGFEVLSATNKPSRKPLFYARWQPAGAGAGKPELNFDIVPTANAGEYQVFFRAEPVPNVDVTAHFPDGKEKELKADEKGIVKFTGDKPGLYMLSCKYQRETIKGFSDGRAYDQLSHNCSITWRQK